MKRPSESISDLKNQGVRHVYFFLHPHGEVYHDDVVYLAEGLEALGITCYGNRNFWKRDESDDSFLIRHDLDVSYHDCQVAVVAGLYFHHIDPMDFSITHASLPSDFFDPHRSYATVYTDTNDGWRTPSWDQASRKFDLILRTKLNRNCPYPSNMKPWVLGFSQRVINASTTRLPFHQRKYKILDNFYFTHTYDHGLRSLARKSVYPGLAATLEIDYLASDKCSDNESAYDRLMNQQTQGKHHPEYFRALGKYTIVSSFCGELLPAYPKDAAKLHGGGRKVSLLRFWGNLMQKFLPDDPRLIQWDSWRFWESLICGAIPLHLDLEKYGVLLPVMPENGKHYIGLNLDHLKDDLERITHEPSLLENVADHSRAWAITHYSPAAAAERFLNYL